MKAFIEECRRRRVFRTAAVYIVGAWIVLQVFSLAFDSWGVPSQALRYVWIAIALGFPVALIFGWRFDIAGGRIVRTIDAGDVDFIAAPRRLRHIDRRSCRHDFDNRRHAWRDLQYPFHWSQSETGLLTLIRGRSPCCHSRI